MLWFDSRSGTEVLELRECLELLAGDEIGRLAIVEAGHPLILPVNYVAEGESILIRTGQGSKLRASHGEPACFEIDGFDRAGRSGWSVVVRGPLRRVGPHDPPTGPLPDSWIADRDHLLRVHGEIITGRRVGPRPEGSR